MNKPQPDVKTACVQTDFATDRNVEKEVLDLVVEHDPTKPEKANVGGGGSTLDRPDNKALDEKPLTDQE